MSPLLDATSCTSTSMTGTPRAHCTGSAGTTAAAGCWPTPYLTTKRSRGPTTLGSPTRAKRR
eukprot:10326365-Alexandrium_andersonii.AAC.1